MNRSKQNFYINLSVAVLLVASFLYFGVKYFITEIENSSAKIVEDKKTINVLSAKNDQLAESKKKYEDMQTKTDLAFATILDKDKTVDFITEVEKVADNEKVKLRISTFSDKSAKTPGSFISTSGFRFTVGGNFSDIMDFLYALENFKYENDIDNLKMGKGDFDEHNKDMIVLNFDLKLYQKNS